MDRKVASCHVIWSYLGHPRLSGILQAVRHDISGPKTFANSFLTTF